MGTALRILATLIVVALAVAAGAWLWHYYLYSPWTRDARVRADVITVAPDVSGWVRTLSVADNQGVERGDELFRIDRARYRVAVDEAKAAVASARARLERKRHVAERRSRLSREAISTEDREAARIDTRVAEAALASAKADLDKARLELERTTVTAPASGHVLNLQLAEGDYASAGTAVMALVKSGSYYVTGYFEETKMPRIHAGDAAEVILMSGDTRLSGHVAGIGRGIADTNTAPNGQLLPQVQPTFNWVRLAQRIPVRIALDEVPAGTRLSAGMTATVRIVDDRD
ncbi:efflux RND transporter periplasmic adaptor subunit [Arhodomonas aquaeolei]|uniref:efflux RND transporter periplasmic adaptor subunit n=1 Tax=Arhodomonas aquaeolei TaxID=2369 RepID=UPI000372B7CA|nr:HlyD family secretion protein [Arhodomonas aquaeolei]